jgi:hypothetical protein
MLLQSNEQSIETKRWDHERDIDSVRGCSAGGAQTAVHQPSSDSSGGLTVTGREAGVAPRDGDSQLLERPASARG